MSSNPPTHPFPPIQVNLDRLDYCSCLENLDEVKYYKVSPALPPTHPPTLPPVHACGSHLPSVLFNLLTHPPAHLTHLQNYKFIKGNICSSDLVNYVMEEEEIDTIMHFAAQTHVDNSFGNSFSFTQNNILGTHVLLESAKVHGIKRFIHVSTDEVYGEGRVGGLGGVGFLFPFFVFLHVLHPPTHPPTHSGAADQEPMFEDQVLEPTNPYAATKAGAEFIAKSYSRSFNLPLIITRGNNVYGPHQYPEKLIPKFVNLLQRDRPVTLHGNGLNTRNFLYVEVNHPPTHPPSSFIPRPRQSPIRPPSDIPIHSSTHPPPTPPQDVARAFDTILHRGVTGKIYNIGGTNEKANLEVAKDLIRLMGHADKEEKMLQFVEDRAFNDLRYTVNSEALKQLGWKEMVSWYVLSPYPPTHPHSNASSLPPSSHIQAPLSSRLLLLNHLPTHPLTHTNQNREDGLQSTVDWYKTYASRYGNIEGALVAHPRAGGAAQDFSS